MNFFELNLFERIFFFFLLITSYTIHKQRMKNNLYENYSGIISFSIDAKLIASDIFKN